MELRTVDFFAGIGGVRLAFEKAGFSTTYANDFDKYCKKTYDLNFKNTKLSLKDIQTVEEKILPDFDFLLGGFPCQAFSVAGERKGFQDSRGMLFFDIARIIKAKKPIGFFLENVKNLEGHNFGKTFSHILNVLDKLGYDVKYKNLNTMEYAQIPQNRERIYIVGFKKTTGLMKNFKFPNKVKLTKNIEDFLEKPNKISQRYYYKK